MFFKRARFGRAVLCIAFVTGLCGCARKTAGPPPRYAFLRFENLTGDPSLDWVGRAASEVLSSSLARAMDGPVIATAAMLRLGATLGARPYTAPGVSSQRQSALLSGATHLVSGYIAGSGGGLRVVATEEDAATGKTVRTVSASGRSPLEALTLLARQFAPAPAPYLTNNADALRLYLSALDAPPAGAIPSIEESLRSDPNYGPAWNALVGLTAAAGGRDAVLATIARSKNQKLDPLSVADIELERATIENDQPARLAALRRIIALSPGDTALLQAVAESETNAGQFAEAAENWKKLTEILPGDIAVWNQLGYTRAWGGDYAGALAALREYARLRPNDPNPLDSTGDVHYMYRKFAEAARSYAGAHAKDPQFERGASLYKAAWAKYQLHDLAGADKTFNQFTEVREKARAPDVALVRGDWLYRTGRRKEAVAFLRNAAQDAAGAQVADATTGAQVALFAQLAAWELMEGDRAAAAADMARTGRPTSGALVLLRFAGQPSASAGEWESRAEKMLPGPNAAALRLVAVGYALLLDGKKAAAIPVWEKIAAASPATDFVQRAAYLHCRGEQPKLAVVPNVAEHNNFAGLFDEK